MARSCVAHDYEDIEDEIPEMLAVCRAAETYEGGWLWSLRSSRCAEWVINTIISLVPRRAMISYIVSLSYDNGSSCIAKGS
jgi:hypothetical protein